MPPRDLSTFQSFLTQTTLSSSLPTSLLLIGLEALIEQEFICPCSGKLCNIVATLTVFVTPPLFACALMSFYSTYIKPQNNNNENKCARVINYLIPVSVWFFVSFLDGQYLACVCADWEGKYVFNLKKKWCKPSGQINWDDKQKKYACTVFWSQVNIMYGKNFLRWL